MMVACKHCGSEFTVTNNRTTFCSIQCSHDYKMVQRNVRRGKQKKLCPVCKSQYILQQSSRCSKCAREDAVRKSQETKLSNLLWNPKPFIPAIEKFCQECNESFFTIYENKACCSPLCSRRRVAKRNSNKKYDNRKKRLDMRGTLVPWSNPPEQGCTLCGENRVYDFAHINKQEVVVLCPNHHRMFDKGIITIDELKDNKEVDIPDFPIVPSQGVMDKTGIFLLRS